MGKITAIEPQKRNKERVNVFIDGVFTLALSALEAARLKKGQVLSEDEIARLREGDTVVKAVDRAVRYIAIRPRSAQEVRRYLAEKDTPPDVIDAALERITELGYLDDAAFAQLWVTDRQTFKPRSPSALRRELQQKGVPSDVIKDVLEPVDAEDAAYRAALGQVRRLRGSTHRDFKQKIGAFLGRRGFGYAVARAVATRLIEEQPDGFFAGSSPDDEPAEDSDLYTADGESAAPDDE